MAESVGSPSPVPGDFGRALGIAVLGSPGWGAMRRCISAMFREMHRGLPDSPDFSEIRRVLVVKLRHHGDVLLTSPVFSVLKNRVPHLEIDALVYSDTREMLERHPAISRIHLVGRDWRRLSATARLAREWDLLSALRGREFDLLVHLTEHPRGAWLSRMLHCRFSIAPGYQGRSRFWRNSFSHLFSLPLNANRHMVEWNLDALRRLGIHPDPEERRLTLIAGQEADSRVAGILADAGLSADGFIHLHPASRWSFKCWPAKRTADLIDLLGKRGEQVVVTAAPTGEERELVENILARCTTSPVDLSGKLTLSDLAALTARAKLFVGVYSAPMHIAAAMGTPVVALFGPSGDREWGPWMVPHRVIASAMHPCRPCGRDGCGGSKVSDCLETLTALEVLSASESLLA